MDGIHVRSTSLFCLESQRLSGDKHCLQVVGPGTKCRDTLFLENHIIKGMAMCGMFIGTGILIVLLCVAVSEWAIGRNGTIKYFGMMMMRNQVMAQKN